MTRFILALIRIFALCVSFILSTLAAAAFVTFSLFLGADAGWLREDPLVAVGALGFTTSVWLMIAPPVLVPFTGIVLIAEFSRLSSLLFNLLIGGACAMVFMVLEFDELGSDLPYRDSEIWLAALAAGFVGGLTHWIIAGHRAGKWLGPQSTSS